MKEGKYVLVIPVHVTLYYVTYFFKIKCVLFSELLILSHVHLNYHVADIFVEVKLSTLPSIRHAVGCLLEHYNQD